MNKLTLASKCSAILILMILNNMCRAYSPNCGGCAFNYKGRCNLRRNHLYNLCNYFSDRNNIVRQLSISCSFNQISCRECTMSEPGTSFCNFAKYRDRIIN